MIVCEGCTTHGIKPISVITFVLKLCESVAHICPIHHIEFLSECRKGNIARIVYNRICFTTAAFGGDDNYTGSTASAVNRCGRSIFQDINTFNIFWSHRT